MMLNFLALQGAPYIYDISKLRVRVDIQYVYTEKKSIFNA
jgi:hypothetical protein